MCNPTEAQVEAAAKAHRKHGKGNEYAGIVCRECDEYFEDRAGFDAHRWRAALVAVQGAAPQAESDPYRIVRVLHEHQRDTSVTSRVKCVCGVTCEDRASHRLHQVELIAHLEAAPVLPSSTVDEDALAEVIREALRDDRLRVAYGAPVNKPQHVVVARAVAEWLKEQCRAEAYRREETE